MFIPINQVFFSLKLYIYEFIYFFIKKVERWEKEVSQALDLAAGYKSKCEFLETELNVTKEANDERVSHLESKLKETEGELQKLNEERKILTDKLNISEEEHLKVCSYFIPVLCF